jgi:hypothetical protein
MSKQVSSKDALHQVQVQMAAIRKEKPSRKHISKLSAAIELLAVILSRQALQ